MEINPSNLEKRRRSKLKKNSTKLGILIAVCVVFMVLYMLINVKFSKPNLAAYQLSKRLPKLIAITIAGFSIGAASIVFQSVIHNNMVTPCLLGMNSLYTLVHTLVAFFLGTSSVIFLNANLSFGLDLILMVVTAYFIYGIMFKKTKYNVIYILLIGTVLSSLFSSIQNSLIRVMDPNEYDTLLTTLQASFENINSSIILVSVALLGVVAVILRKEIKVLNVLTLGKDVAINLGVDYDTCVKKLLVGVTIYIAIATAMVGPISFLGLITANITRQLFKTYKHKYLLFGTVLASIIVLLIGQVIVEHIFSYGIPISIFITLGGGMYFLYLILKSQRRIKV